MASFNITTEHPFTEGVAVKKNSGSNEMDVESIALYTTIGFIGTIGNIFVITVFGSSPVLRSKKVNILLINQSVIDLVSSIFLAASSNNKPNKKGNYHFCI